MCNGKLTNHMVYLAGPIDRVEDCGRSWRDELTPWLVNELGMKVLNPLNKPIDLGLEDDVAREEINALKRAGKYDDLRQKYSVIRNVDLRMTDLCSVLIAYIDLDVVMCGTWEEVFQANRCKKPVLCVVKQGKCEAPNWLFFTIPHEHIFSSFAELKNYLLDVHTGVSTRHFKRWFFFNF